MDKKKSDNNKLSGSGTLATKPDKIVGEWIIGETESLDTNVSCNSCPKIYFRDNGDATVDFLDSPSGHYNWSINADTLKLQCAEPANTFPFFYSLNYKMTYTDKKNHTELALAADSIVYFLRH